MNIVLAVLLLYLLFLITNNELNKYIVNKIDNKVALYMEKYHIDLNEQEELVMESLVTHFCEELMTSSKLEYLPFISIWQILKNVYTLDGEIEQFIFYLNQCHSALMKTTPNTPTTKKEPRRHFISYMLNGKRATVIFTLEDGEVNIIEVSASLQEKDEKELYTDLLDALALIKMGSKDFNYSSHLVEDYQDELKIAQKQDLKLARINKKTTN